MVKFGRQELRAALTDVQAVVFHDGAIEACELQNLSAGGMLVRSRAVLAPGSELTLGLRLAPDLAEAAGLDYLSFQVEVLESLETDEVGVADYRLRNLTSEGSQLYERARSLVYQALRSPGD